MGCHSRQPSYIYKPKRGKHLMHVAFSDKRNGAWDFHGKAAVRHLCSSLISNFRKKNLMIIFLQDSLV